ncbi:MAG: PAC2 family protein [Candidatus Helarchaeota archaeon]|nr:PAC2 family protein [Candidatus Helarchaeota archaeon]
MIKRKPIKDMPKLDSPLALIGMPGIAMVGKLALINIVSSLNAEESSEVYHDDLPPHVIIDEGGEMRLPKVTIFFIKNPEISHDLVLFTSDYQPTTSAGIYQLSDYVCGYCQKLGVVNIISTGAFVPESLKKPYRQVYISGSSEEFINFFLESKTGTTILLKGGYITGANGIIPAWGKVHYDIDGACLLADTLPMRALDPTASKAIVEVLNERYDLKSDVNKLEKQISEVELVSSEIKKRLKEEKERQQRETRPYIS